MKDDYWMVDASKATPELYAALVNAQSTVATVGKDGRNKVGGYNYATAEAMIRTARQAMTDAGLGVVISHRVFTASDRAVTVEIGKQSVSGLLKATAVVFHSSGGYLVTSHDVHVVASPRRPHDKAEMAALTYLHGFILRSLLNMDRAEEDGDAVDRREDAGNDEVRPPRRPSKPNADDPVKALSEAMRRLGNTRGWSGADVFEEAAIEYPVAKGWIPTDADRAKLWGAIERLGKTRKEDAA